MLSGRRISDASVVTIAVAITFVSAGKVGQSEQSCRYTVSTESSSIQLIYFHSDSNRGDIVVTGGNFSDVKQYFREQHPVVIVVGGFLSQIQGRTVQRIKNVYTAHQSPFNVFALDWTELNGARCCFCFDYCTAASNVPTVGNKLALLMFEITRQLMQSHVGAFILVGHSLGSHICGYASRTFKAKKPTTSGEIHPKDRRIEIHVLDAARPGFPGYSNFSPAVNASDADFVIAFYTDAGHFGMKEKIGHVNILLNGGIRHQPRCRLVDIIHHLAENPTDFFHELISCSHTAAVDFYADGVIESAWNPRKSIPACKLTSMSFLPPPQCKIDTNITLSPFVESWSESNWGIFSVSYTGRRKRRIDSQPWSFFDISVSKLVRKAKFYTLCIADLLF